MQLRLKKHGIAETDRVAHELRTLVDIIYLGGSYDQLNLPSLASFEAASRRMQTVEAFSTGSSSVPEWWGHAKLFTGSHSPDDLVSRGLRAWAAKKGREEVELMTARQKMRDARRGLPVDADATRMPRLFFREEEPLRAVAPVLVSSHFHDLLGEKAIASLFGGLHNDTPQLQYGIQVSPTGAVTGGGLPQLDGGSCFRRCWSIFTFRPST